MRAALARVPVIEAPTRGLPVAAIPAAGAGGALRVRAPLAVSRSSAIIARIAVRRQTNQAGEAN